jgi:hypothetical protein
LSIFFCSAADLRGVEEGGEAERRGLLQLPNPSFELPDRALGQVEPVAERAEALLLGSIEQTLPGNPSLAGDVGEPAGQVGDHRRRLERRPGQVRRDHLAQGVEIGPGPLGVTNQVLIEDDPEVASPLTHLIERTAAVAQQVDERHALGIEELEGKPHPLGRILDASEGVSYVAEQVLAPPQVAALVAQRDAHLRQRVLGLAGALRRLRRPAGEALQRHVQGLLFDARRLGGKAQFLQRLDPDTDLVGGLADGIRRRDRAIDQRAETTDRRGADQRTTEGADAGAQQLRLAAEPLQPARGAPARALDALQALLAALAD